MKVVKMPLLLFACMVYINSVVYRLDWKMPEQYTVVYLLKSWIGPGSECHYPNDMLIHTAKLEEHLDSIKKVLQAELDVGIWLKPSKTLFFQGKVDFLGF